MQRASLATFGLVLVTTLFGCASPPPPVAVAPMPVAAPAPSAVPGPVALVPSPPPQMRTLAPAPALIQTVSPSYPVAQAAQPIIHHHWVHRYAANYGVPCGSVAHPCSMSHTVVPIQ